MSYSYHLIFCLASLLATSSISKAEFLTVTPPPDSCQKFDGNAVPYCTALEPYAANESLTALPNDREHDSQAEAYAELQGYGPLIRVQCSGAILEFLCSYYVPICYEIPSSPIIRLRPCKSLCEEVYNNCIDDLEDNGFLWPPHLNCSYFPEDDCFGPADPSKLMLPDYIPGLGSISTPSPTNTTMSTISPSETRSTSDTVQPSSETTDRSTVETTDRSTVGNRSHRSSSTDTTVRPTQTPTDRPTQATTASSFTTTDSSTEDPIVDLNTSGAISIQTVNIVALIALLVMATGEMQIVY